MGDMQKRKIGIQLFKTVLLSVQTIVTDFNASPTDDARDLVNAAQVMLTGERQDVRNLCKPWGVHLTAQKSIAP